jgi:hypothetical protein
MRVITRGTALWGISALALAIWACETTRNPGGIQHDVTSPAITLTITGSDTQDIASGLAFGVSAVDNLALKSVNLTFTGGLIASLDTNFTGQVKNYTVSRLLTFSQNSGAGGSIEIVGRATDGAGNWAEDTISIFLANVQALRVRLVLPSPGALASTGKGLPIDVIAVQNSGIAKVGFLVSPPASVTNPTTPPNDSIIYSSPFADSVEYQDTILVVPSSGTFNVVGFAEDSAGRRGFSSVVTVQIQSVATDVTVPVVAHRIGERVEVDDTIHVRAQDPSAISWIGFRVDTGGLVMKFDTVNVSAGNLTDVTRHMTLGLQGLNPLPRSIVVRGYACDAAVARNCSFTNSTTLIPSPLRRSKGVVSYEPPMAPMALIDTVIVVNGITVPLAGASSIRDAIYNANRRELYLTNPAFNRVDVFQLVDTSFVPGGIPTAGGQPWGIALWPRDILGGYKDTIVVADAGGSYLGIINVGSGGPRQIIWRQDLPDFIIQTYKVTTQAGGAVRHITDYHTSDLPQYVATVCRPVSGNTTCHADSVFALYSTAPTGAETPPFTGRATLRMEKLINTTDPNLKYGHLFWEIATQSFTTVSDTLRIFMSRGRNFSKIVLSACAGATIELARMGLGDRTFARNSGNFTHGFFGEGGNIPAAFARVMSYDAGDQLLQGAPTFTTCGTGNGTSDAGENDVDLGMSPGRDVSDFIANTGIAVVSIATNFNGLTNAVRADSIYYLDQDLRRKVTSAAPPGSSPHTPGMDMNYFHDFAPTGACPPTSTSCGGGTDKNQRVMFSANPNGNIDVFDTYFGAFLGSIAIRDPIVGPLRVARDAGGNQLLFGITPNGLVVLQLPPFTNPLPVPPVR